MIIGFNMTVDQALDMGDGVVRSRVYPGHLYAMPLLITVHFRPVISVCAMSRMSIPTTTHINKPTIVLQYFCVLCVRIFEFWFLELTPSGQSWKFPAS